MALLSCQDLSLGYEGKAILANAILPAVLWCHLLLWQDPERKDVRSILLFAGIASVMCSSSSMFLIPAALGAGGAAVLAAGKYWKLSYWYLLWLLPVVLEGVFYELLGHGILSSAI